MLGETVLTTGTAFTGEPFALDRLLALGMGFTATVALRWCYLQRAELLGARAAETADDAGAVALWGTWTLMLTVLGLIAVAVADELAIADPSDDVTLGFTALAFGGPALFLLARLLFHHAALGETPRSRAMGLTALAVLAATTAPLTLIVGTAASTAVLFAVAVPGTCGQAFRRRAGRRSDLVGGGHDRGPSPARTYSANARSNSGHHA